MRFAISCLWSWCACAVLAAAAAPDAPKPAPPKPVAPSRTTIKPLALEYALIVKLAGPSKDPPRLLAERAQCLKRFGGAGYSIRACAAAPDAASSQRTQRQAAYMALTDVRIQGAAARISEFQKKEKMQIKPGKTAVERQDRAYPIAASEAGIKELIDIQQAIIDSSSGPAPSAQDAAMLFAQREMAKKRIELLRPLKEAMAKFGEAVRAYEAFAADIRATSKKEALAQRVAALQTQAAGLAANSEGVVKAEAVGTQQLRVTLSAEKRDQVRAALAERLSKDNARKDVAFIEGKIDFLPLAWPLSAKIAPQGDFRITEYVCGEELILTLYDATGIWHRIVALEYGVTRYVALAHIESAPDDAK